MGTCMSLGPHRQPIYPKALSRVDFAYSKDVAKVSLDETPMIYPEALSETPVGHDHHRDGDSTGDCLRQSDIQRDILQVESPSISEVSIKDVGTNVSTIKGEFETELTQPTSPDIEQAVQQVTDKSALNGGKDTKMEPPLLVVKEPVVVRQHTQVERKARTAMTFMGVSLGKENIKSFSKVIVDKSPVEKAFIVSGISQHFLLAEVGLDAREDIANAMERELVPGGTDLIIQGEEGNHFYFVQEGHFDVLVNGAKVHEYFPLGSFGELSLLYNCRRAATVRATVDSVVWKVDGTTFKWTLASNADRNRMQSREAIGKIPLFSNLDNDHLDKIVSVIKLSHFKEEEMILRRGEMNAKFYIIVSGQVLLTGWLLSFSLDLDPHSLKTTFISI